MNHRDPPQRGRHSPPIGRRDDRGGWSRLWRRLVDNPENPLGWSVILFRALGITVRIHLFTVAYLLLLLISTLSNNSQGITFALPLVISLFAVVLLHEFGHCFACRWVGGEADRIVIMPFGGLALCHPPHHWKPNLITTLGGPAVNLALFPITAALMVLAGMSGWILFNPLHAYGPLLDPTIDWGSPGIALAKAAAWWLHYTNVLIFAFNMAMVMYPFDAGRIVHALMWRSMGYRRASMLAADIGLVGAMIVAAAALVTQNQLLLFIAIFGGVSCWIERRRARGESDLATESLGAGASTGAFNPYSAAGEADDPADQLPSKRELKRMERELHQQQEVDRILEKIARQGIDSLTAKERGTLARATASSRSASPPKAPPRTGR